MSPSVRTVRSGSALMADAVAQVVWVPATSATGASTTESVDLAAAQSFTTIAGQTDTLGPGGATRSGILSLSGTKVQAVITTTPKEKAYLSVPAQIVFTFSAAAANTGKILINGYNQFDEFVTETLSYDTTAVTGTGLRYQTSCCYKMVDYVQVVPTATGDATKTLAAGWKLIEDATGLWRIPTPFKIRSSKDIAAVFPLEEPGTMDTSLVAGSPITGFVADVGSQSITLPVATVTVQPVAFVRFAVVAANGATQGG